MGLAREALAELTYTQWEAWLDVGSDKDLLIVAPASGVKPGPHYAPSDASRASQAGHLRRLKEIDRYPITFTNADNLIATILGSAVIEALVKAGGCAVRQGEARTVRCDHRGDRCRRLRAVH